MKFTLYYTIETKKKLKNKVEKKIYIYNNYQQETLNEKTYQLRN